MSLRGLCLSPLRAEVLSENEGRAAAILASGQLTTCKSLFLVLTYSGTRSLRVSRPLFFLPALSLASAVFYWIHFIIGEIQEVKDLREESNPQNAFSSQTPFGPEV